MNNELVIKNRLCYLIIIATILSFCSCTTPYNEADIPEEEWGIKNVWYYPSMGSIVISFENTSPRIDDYIFYSSFDDKIPVDWKSMIKLPEGFSVSQIVEGYSRIDFIDLSKPYIPSGTLIYFSDKWFYLAESTTGIPTTTYRAKIRISTRSIPITLVE